MKTKATPLNLEKSDRMYYGTGQQPVISHFDSFPYLALSGQSAPEHSLFLSAIQAVYTLAYGVRFVTKAEGKVFTVPKMECYWYIGGGPEVQHLFTQTPREAWHWRIVIRMPDFVRSTHFKQALDLAKVRKSTLDFSKASLEYSEAGPFASILHIGSWDEEKPTVDLLHKYIEESGHRIYGYHREIYLSDPMRVEEAKKKTILRYQVAPL